ncbi:ubiquitin-related modifier 1 [Apiospora arundinis]
MSRKTTIIGSAAPPFSFLSPTLPHRISDMAAETEAVSQEVDKIPIVVEFSGGLEMLFSDQRRHSLSIPVATGEGKPATVASLIDYLCRNTMKDTRKELFVLDDHLRPGILVLINDADWELEGEEAYEIQSGDNILFVSTLHGG